MLNTCENRDQPKARGLYYEVRARDADLAWYLSMIQLIDKENAIFKPGYENPLKLRKHEIAVDDRLRAYKDAFVGLPAAKRSQAKKRASVVSQIQKEKKPTRLMLAEQELMEIKQGLEHG